MALEFLVFLFWMCRTLPGFFCPVSRPVGETRKKQNFVSVWCLIRLLSNAVSVKVLLHRYMYQLWWYVGATPDQKKKRGGGGEKKTFEIWIWNKMRGVAGVGGGGGEGKTNCLSDDSKLGSLSPVPPPPSRLTFLDISLGWMFPHI